MIVRLGTALVKCNHCDKEGPTLSFAERLPSKRDVRHNAKEYGWRQFYERGEETQRAADDYVKNWIKRGTRRMAEVTQSILEDMGTR